MELDRDEEGITEKPKKTGDRGWAGKGWPGRKCGNPFTADGSEFVNDISRNNSISNIALHSLELLVFNPLICKSD